MVSWLDHGAFHLLALKVQNKVPKIFKAWLDHFDGKMHYCSKWERGIFVVSKILSKAVETCNTNGTINSYFIVQCGKMFLQPLEILCGVINKFM